MDVLWNSVMEMFSYYWWIILIPVAPISILIILHLFMLAAYGKKFTMNSLKNAKRDLKGLSILIRMRYRCSIAFQRNRGVQKMFLDVVRKNKDKTAILEIATETSYTFQELNEMSCRYAHLLQKEGVRSGDVVALILENSVLYVAAWLACAKIGAVSAWINTNLRRESLAHTLLASNAKTIICNSHHSKNVAELLNLGLLNGATPKILVLDGPHADNISGFPVTEPIPEKKPVFTDPLCYIYTSGTTGLPKAAVIKHFRFFYIATGGECAFGVKPKTDRIYICLPMYHTSAGVLGLGQTILHGATCVIRPKFSASNFFADCCRYDCNVCIYIGELLRYLLLSPKSEFEKKHSLRLLIGNGLRPAIWRRFQERFNVGRIAEFYGSTEGTSNLVNIDGHLGSCGFMTILPIFAPLYPVRLFRVNKDGELQKDENGYLVPIRPGECGALACTIKKNNPLYHFEGYLDKQETAKKVIREPRPGADPVFLSGDILYWDGRGYFYFKDRMGDTFRWKGENVSTTEVEAIFCGVCEIEESTVYGVEVPGCEGRAGMAALVFTSSLLIESGLSIDDVMKKIYEESTKTLPSYAVPLFIRIQKTLDKTGTFKMKKTELQAAGFGFLEDSTVFYLEQKNSQTYLPMTEDIKKEIEQETFKF